MQNFGFLQKLTQNVARNCPKTCQKLSFGFGKNYRTETVSVSVSDSAENFGFGRSLTFRPYNATFELKVNIDIKKFS